MHGLLAFRCGECAQAPTGKFFNGVGVGLVISQQLLTVLRDSEFAVGRGDAHCFQRQREPRIEFGKALEFFLLWQPPARAPQHEQLLESEHRIMRQGCRARGLQFFTNTEQIGDEIIQQRRAGEQQLAVLNRCQRFALAHGQQRLVERRVQRFQTREIFRIEARKALEREEVGIGQSGQTGNECGHEGVS